jgi:pimeloyl-ACP methyl ester carboxylesterase
VTTVQARELAAGRPDGPLAVLAHGLEDTWAIWRRLAGHLDPSWRVVALDLPWRAGNDYRWRRRPPGEWVAAGLDLLDAPPDLLVAHSFGANATLDLLCAPPARPVRAVALLCPLYRPPEQPVSWRAFERSRATFVQHIRDGVRARMGARAYALDPAVLEGIQVRAVERVGPTGFLTVFDEFTASADRRLESVTVPTLVFVGGADPTLSRRAAAGMVRRMPGARLWVNQQYDHFCHVKFTREIAAQVTDLLGAAAGAAGEGR